MKPPDESRPLLDSAPPPHRHHSFPGLPAFASEGNSGKPPCPYPVPGWHPFSPSASLTCPFTQRPCRLTEIEQCLCHWAHRCVFSGDGIQAWLMGLCSDSQPLDLVLDDALTVIITFGEADLECAGHKSHLTQGQTLALPPRSAFHLDSPTQADVLLLINSFSPPQNPPKS